MSPKKKLLPFNQVLNELLDMSRPFPAVHLHRFSDLSPADLAGVMKIWPKVDKDRQVALLEDLEELVESDTLVSFDELAKTLLNDPEPRVRAVAIRLLWQSEDPKLVPLLINLLQKDDDAIVRAAAATGLGNFIYLGELDNIPPLIHKQIEDVLLAKIQGNDLPLVRRRALEAMGFSSRQELPPLIEAAYKSKDKDWIGSALFAMGRSADERWSAIVYENLDAADPDLQFEAVRAAGELDLKNAREYLLEKLAHADEMDEDVRMAAVWSLSQIGGEGVQDALMRLLEETEDDDEADYIEMALENLSLMENLPGFEMLDLSTMDEDNSRIVDLSLHDEDEDEDERTPKGSGRKKQRH